MIRLATKEDKKWHIDEWARLFKASTWEELKMIAEKDQVYSEAANSIYIQNSDETVRAMCEARQEAIFHEKYVQKQLKEKDERLSQQEAQLSQQEDVIAQQEAVIAQLQSELDSLKNNNS